MFTKILLLLLVTLVGHISGYVVNESYISFFASFKNTPWNMLSPDFPNFNKFSFNLRWEINRSKSLLSEVELYCSDFTIQKGFENNGDNKYWRYISPHAGGSASSLMPGFVWHNYNIGLLLAMNDPFRFNCTVRLVPHSMEYRTPKSCSCGRGIKWEKVKRIPFLALLRRRGGHGNICTVSIISNRHILTSARSIADMAAADIVVIVRTSNAKDEWLSFDVRRKIIHPDNKLNDIAVLQVAQNITFSEFVRPVCLFSNEHLLNFAEQWLKVVGVVQTDEEDPANQTFQIVDHVGLDMERCKRAHNGTLDIHSQFCGIDPYNNTSKCVVNGVVLYLDLMYGRYFQVGITSNRADCAADKPAVYTSVHNYMPWILNITSRSIVTVVQPKKKKSRFWKSKNDEPVVEVQNVKSIDLYFSHLNYFNFKN